MTPSGDRLPRVSFVVPAYNEAGFIEDCLRSIRRHMDPLDIHYELIVVDNGSTDETPNIARSLGAEVLEIERTSVSGARNCGAGASEGTWIAFIDADVVLTPEWATTLWQLLEADHQELLVTGHQYVVRDDSSWIEDTWFRHLVDRYLNGGNIVITRAAVERVGGFDPSLKTGEDYDFCGRLIEAGVTYAPDPGFRAIHMGFPRDLVNFVKREIWHGEGDFRSLRALASSPVALISTGYAVLQLAALALLAFGRPRWALGALGLLLAFNVAITIYRFRPGSLRQFWWNNVAHYFYFMARAVSPVRALRNRRKPY